jgi:hypothetical protein
MLPLIDFALLAYSKPAYIENYGIATSGTSFWFGSSIST